MKLSRHFDSSEFDCKCGCGKRPQTMPPQELLDCLEKIREAFDAPIIINSGYRCQEHNARVGGAKSSRHLKGDAVDFTIKGIKTVDAYNYVLKAFGEKPYGIAIKRRENPYGGFVHLDVRGKKARWEYK